MLLSQIAEDIQPDPLILKALKSLDSKGAPPSRDELSREADKRRQPLGGAAILVSREPGLRLCGESNRNMSELSREINAYEFHPARDLYGGALNAFGQIVEGNPWIPQAKKIRE